MTSNDFINILDKYIKNTTARGVISVLEKPPGKKPDKKLIETSNWYIRLNDDDKKMVASIVNDTVKSALFNFLCVIDGVIAIESSGKKGRLELSFCKDNERVLLNDPGEEYLHDKFKGLE